jgi:hypothetical protein
MENCRREALSERTGRDLEARRVDTKTLRMLRLLV